MTGVLEVVRLRVASALAGAAVLTAVLAAAPAADAVADQRFDPGEAAERQLASDISAFAVAFHPTIAPADRNFAWSPQSLATLLAILHAGARGATAEEIQRAARFTLTGDRLHAAFRTLGRSLRKDSPGSPPSLRLAAAVWSQADTPIVPAFASIAKTQYGAAVRKVDFAVSTADAIRTINAWASDATAGKVPHLVTAASVTSDTRLVLTTAVYFREKWQHRFDAASTRTASFATPDGPMDVRMMSRRATLPYGESESFQLLELPYAGGRFSMLVYLPARGHAAKATLADLIRAYSTLQSRTVLVHLPAFRVAGEISLGDPLVRAGVRTAFSAAADFSGLTTARGLSLSAVLQTAVIEVSEEGTEAAAASAGVVGITSDEEPVVFRADRPFLFAIRDSSQGVILFAGSVASPSP